MEVLTTLVGMLISQKSRGVAPTGQTGMMWPNKASGSVTSYN